MATLWVSTPPAETFTAVSAGISRAYAIRTDGTLACWGTHGLREW